jgi:hypothetical protein
MNGGEITQNLSNNYTYQYTQMVNAPAEGQAGAARCCHRAKCFSLGLGFADVFDQRLVQAKPMDT